MWQIMSWAGNLKRGHDQGWLQPQPKKSSKLSLSLSMATARFGFKGSTEGCEDKATCTNMSLPSLRGDLFKLARSLAGSRSVRAQLHGKDVLLIPAMLPYVTQTTQKHQSANGAGIPKVSATATVTAKATATATTTEAAATAT